MQREILNELSKEIIAGSVSAGDNVKIDIDGSKIVFRSTPSEEIVK